MHKRHGHRKDQLKRKQHTRTMQEIKDTNSKKKIVEESSTTEQLSAPYNYSPYTGSIVTLEVLFFIVLLSCWTSTIYASLPLMIVVMISGWIEINLCVIEQIKKKKAIVKMNFEMTKSKLSCRTASYSMWLLNLLSSSCFRRHMRKLNYKSETESLSDAEEVPMNSEEMSWATESYSGVDNDDNQDGDANSDAEAEIEIILNTKNDYCTSEVELDIKDAALQTNNKCDTGNKDNPSSNKQGFFETNVLDIQYSIDDTQELQRYFCNSPKSGDLISDKNGSQYPKLFTTREYKSRFNNSQADENEFLNNIDHDDTEVIGSYAPAGLVASPGFNKLVDFDSPCVTPSLYYRWYQLQDTAYAGQQMLLADQQNMFPLNYTVDVQPISQTPLIKNGLNSNVTSYNAINISIPNATAMHKKDIQLLLTNFDDACNSFIQQTLTVDPTIACRTYFQSEYLISICDYLKYVCYSTNHKLANTFIENEKVEMFDTVFKFIDALYNGIFKVISIMRLLHGKPSNLAPYTRELLKYALEKTSITPIHHFPNPSPNTNWQDININDFVSLDFMQLSLSKVVELLSYTRKNGLINNTIWRNISEKIVKILTILQLPVDASLFCDIDRLSAYNMDEENYICELLLYYLGHTNVTCANFDIMKNCIVKHLDIIIKKIFLSQESMRKYRINKKHELSGLYGNESNYKQRYEAYLFEAGYLYYNLCLSDNMIYNLENNIYFDLADEKFIMIENLFNFMEKFKLYNGMSFIHRSYIQKDPELLKKYLQRYLESYLKDNSKIGYELALDCFTASNNICRSSNEDVYNVLISRGMEYENYIAIYMLFDSMLEEKLKFDNTICLDILKKFDNCLQVEEACKLLNFLMAKLHESSNTFLMTSMLNTCINLRKNNYLLQLLAYIESLLTNNPENLPDAFLCGTLLKAYSKLKRLDKARLLWKRCISSPCFEPTSYTYGCLFNTFVKNDCVEEALKLFHECFDDPKYRIHLNTVIYSIMIQGCAKAKKLDQALKFHDDMKRLNIYSNHITFNTLISACISMNDMGRAYSILNSMKSIPNCAPDVISYSILIKGYCDHGDIHKAIMIFETMQNEGVQSDHIVYNTLLEGLSRCGSLKDAESFYYKMIDAGMIPSSFTLTILIKLYSKAGLIDVAQEVIETLPQRYSFSKDIYVFTAMIAACLMNQRIHLAIHYFEVMRQEIPSTKITGRVYGTIILGCTNYHKFVQAYQYICDAYQRDLWYQVSILRKFINALLSYKSDSIAEVDSNLSPNLIQDMLSRCSTIVQSARYSNKSKCQNNSRDIRYHGKNKLDYEILQNSVQSSY